MPFDAMFLTAVAAELRPALVGARVDKIQQPARDTVVLQLRGRDGGGRLLLSANGNRPRVHLTQAQLENPAQPPMFCMLLRKHLAGGRLAGIRQPAAERMLDLTFDCTDELGVPCRKHLILELFPAFDDRATISCSSAFSSSAPATSLNITLSRPLPTRALAWPNFIMPPLLRMSTM